MTNKTITISRETFQGLLEGIAYGGHNNNSRLDMFHRVLGEPWETVTMCEADARLLLCGFSYVNKYREELLAALRRADEKEHSDHIAAEFEREGKKLPPGFHNCTAERAVTGIVIQPAKAKDNMPLLPIGCWATIAKEYIGIEHIWDAHDSPWIGRTVQVLSFAPGKHGTVATVVDLHGEMTTVLNDLLTPCVNPYESLQSELTKALELLQNCTDCVRNGEDFDLPVTTMASIDAFRANQSVPADKGQGEPVAWTVRGVNGSLDPSYSTCFKDEAESWPETLVDGCEVVPLYAAQPAPVAVLPEKYDDVLLPFLSLMRAELHANAHKGDRPGWLQMDRKTAVLEVFYHMGKLHMAVHRNDKACITEYAADVANMCMMLTDVCGCLNSEPKS